MNYFTKKDTDQLKGIAILMMILHHLFAYPLKVQDYFTVETSSIWYLLARYGRICVPVFLLISGYGMYASYQKDKQVKEKIVPRLRSLYQMYWRVFLIWIPIGFLIGAYQMNAVGWKELILNFIGLHSTMNGEWWFFYLYILLVLLAPCLIAFVARCHYLFTSACIVLYCYLVVYGVAGIETTALYQSFVSLPLAGQTIWVLTWGIAPYLTGALLAKYQIFNQLSRLPEVSISLLSGFLLVGSMYFFLKGYDAPLWNVLHAICVMLFSRYCVKKIPYLNTLLMHLGTHSNMMWLLHTFWIYYYFPRIAFLLPTYLFTFVWVVFLSYLSAFCTEKVTQMVWKCVFKRKRMV